MLDMKIQMAAKGRVRVTAQVENIERPHTGAKNALLKRLQKLQKYNKMQNYEGQSFEAFQCLYTCI